MAVLADCSFQRNICVQCKYNRCANGPRVLQYQRLKLKRWTRIACRGVSQHQGPNLQTNPEPPPGGVAGALNGETSLTQNIAVAPRQNRRGPVLPRMVIARRIHDAVYRSLHNQKLFTLIPDDFPEIESLWVSESFHIVLTATQWFTAFAIYPVLNNTGLNEHPQAESKVMNLHRLPDGSYNLPTFRRGDWEEALLRYVGAPLGLLTIRPC
jgi:hypothetical protein